MKLLRVGTRQRSRPAGCSQYAALSATACIYVCGLCAAVISIILYNILSTLRLVGVGEGEQVAKFAMTNQHRWVFGCQDTPLKA